MKVLFVCTGNACRSPLAEALLKKFRPDVDVDSAGTHAYYRVVDLTRRYAEQEGADEFLKRTPEDLDVKTLCEYDVIVAMESRHERVILDRSPECADRVVVWHITDPYAVPYRQAQQIFEKIKSKVAHLAKSL
ncbi:MAG: low molecular weight phosphatase family protein [Candidatus Bathyarchaeum sp.]|nr:MAG: low molecular weight phosphatase family protein [Candidatus Bathyarchaeum sp.]